MNKAIVIVLAVIALGLFTVAGSVVYSAQQIPNQPTSVKTQFENDLLLDCINPRIESDLYENTYFTREGRDQQDCLRLLRGEVQGQPYADG